MNTEQEREPAAQTKIRVALRRYDMLPRGGRVVAGVSGGADSMTLVHFLLHEGVPVLAAHVNHGLRGAESDADEVFVRTWCEQNGVPLRVLSADVKQRAAESGEGLEECGRRVRYDFFASLCAENDKIATAHTLSDSAETVLLNLARGTGTRGLCGIPAVRGRIIRPLIETTRDEVEAYCAFYGLPYRNDSTNADRRYARNRVRLDAVPALKKVNPSFEQAVLRMTGRLCADDAYLTVCAREKLRAAKCGDGYRVSELAALPEPLLTRAVLLALKEDGRAGLSAEHVLAAAGMIRGGRGAATAAGNVGLRVENGLFFLTENGREKKRWRVPLQMPKTLTEGGRAVIIRVVGRQEYENNLKFNNLLFNNALNYDTIMNNSFFRNRRDGDRFCPARRGVTKTLKKLFNEEKIPPSRRDDVLLLENGGEILWIEGIGPAQKSRVCGDTEKIALLIIRSAADDK